MNAGSAPESVAGRVAGDSSVQAVDRALRILEILADNGPTGVTPLAKALGVPGPVTTQNALVPQRLAFAPPSPAPVALARPRCRSRRPMRVVAVGLLFGGATYGAQQLLTASHVTPATPNRSQQRRLRQLQSCNLSHPSRTSQVFLKLNWSKGHSGCGP